MGSDKNNGNCFDTINHNSGGENKTVPGKNNNKNDNVDVLTEGFLLLLRDFILVLPDSKAEYVLINILKIEMLIVMANHPSPRVRIAVIKVVYYLIYVI